MSSNRKKVSTCKDKDICIYHARLTRIYLCIKRKSCLGSRCCFFQHCVTNISMYIYDSLINVPNTGSAGKATALPHPTRNLNPSSSIPFRFLIASAASLRFIKQTNPLFLPLSFSSWVRGHMILTDAIGPYFPNSWQRPNSVTLGWMLLTNKLVDKGSPSPKTESSDLNNLEKQAVYKTCACNK